jgi:hypothetical protein
VPRVRKATEPEPPASAALVAADVDREPGSHPTTPLSAHDGFTPEPRDNAAGVGGQELRPPTKQELRDERYG